MDVVLDTELAAVYARTMYEADPLRDGTGVMPQRWDLLDPQVRRAHVDRMQAFLDRQLHLSGR